MFLKLLYKAGLVYGPALARAVHNAWRTHSAGAAAAGAGSVPRGATIPVSEAAKILNVDENAATVEEINAAFERMYDANSPEKGNSFYLQSKVYRAREAMLAHLKANDNDADLEPPPGSGGTGGSTVADKQ